MVMNKVKDKHDIRLTKVSPSKVMSYIRDIELNGKTRIQAYAENIDSKIYDWTPEKISWKLNHLRERYPGYKEMKESVLAEDREWGLRKSVAIQGAAVDLLMNTIHRANELVNKEGVTAKDLQAATTTLKAIMPAFGSLAEKKNVKELDATERKSRAARVIA